MARFDVYPMPGLVAQGYLLDVQADILGYLNTRTVVPLLPKSAAPAAIRSLNPALEIEGKPYTMLTQAIATLPARDLRGKVASLGNHHDDIMRALDILFTGL
jgi:toxin CcdB